MMNEFQQHGGACRSNIVHYLSELNDEEFQKLPGGGGAIETGRVNA